MTERTEAEASRETLQQYREVTAAVVGFVRSQEVTRAFTSISLEELIDRRINRIEAPMDGERPGALARILKIKNDFEAAIEGIRATPPDAFRAPDPSTDANTPDTTTPTTGSTA